MREVYTTEGAEEVNLLVVQHCSNSCKNNKVQEQQSWKWDKLPKQEIIEIINLVFGLNSWFFFLSCRRALEGLAINGVTSIKTNNPKSKKNWKGRSPLLRRIVRY